MNSNSLVTKVNAWFNLIICCTCVEDFWCCIYKNTLILLDPTHWQSLFILILPTKVRNLTLSYNKLYFQSFCSFTQPTSILWQSSKILIAACPQTCFWLVSSVTVVSTSIFKQNTLATCGPLSWYPFPVFEQNLQQTLTHNVQQQKDPRLWFSPVEP